MHIFLYKYMNFLIKEIYSTLFRKTEAKFLRKIAKDS